MRYEIVLDQIPAGFAMESHPKGFEGEVLVSTMGFTSSENGERLVEQLEFLSSVLLSKSPATADILPSTIDHMLGVIRRDRPATLYVNEPDLVLRVRAKRALAKGEKVYPNDIADIGRLSLGEVSVPPEAGLVFLFSQGWRRGLFYDLDPLHKDGLPRDYDLELLLGSYYSYLMNQKLFTMTEEQWSSLFQQMWFPFISLRRETVKQMLAHPKENWPVDQLLDGIVAEVSSSLQAMVERWRSSALLAPHMPLLECAVERFSQKDYISPTSILYTRIEGIMRSLLQSVTPGAKSTQESLPAAVVEAGHREFPEYSLLLPMRFQNFLKEVYFAGFKPGSVPPLSRPSVAHGVARSEDFSAKAATIGLLIVDQIFFFLPAPQGGDSPEKKPS